MKEELLATQCTHMVMRCVFQVTNPRPLGSKTKALTNRGQRKGKQRKAIKAMITIELLKRVGMHCGGPPSSSTHKDIISFIHSWLLPFLRSAEPLDPAFSPSLVQLFLPPMASIGRSNHVLVPDEEDSGSDLGKVPDIAEATDNSSAALPTKAGGGRKRADLQAEKEHKRMKRLLRNRVSAQQARERKKAYVNDLEARAKDLEQRNALLEEKVSTLQQENAMLRKVIRSSTTLKLEGSSG